MAICQGLMVVLCLISFTVGYLGSSESSHNDKKWIKRSHVFFTKLAIIRYGLCFMLEY